MINTTFNQNLNLDISNQTTQFEFNLFGEKGNI